MTAEFTGGQSATRKGMPGAVTGSMPLSLAVAISPGSSAGEAQVQLSIESGAAGAAFGFQYDLPSWPAPRLVTGSPVQVASVGLPGPGSIRAATSGPPPKPVLPRRNACIRETAAPNTQRSWVELPPNTTSVVSLRLRGTYPAWPGTRYGLSFSTFPVDDPFAQLAPLASVNVSRFAPRGTRIEIRAKEQPTAQTTPEIIGRTFPPFRQARIALRAVRPSRSGSVRLEDWADPRPPAISLGAVRTDRQGRFRVPPRRSEAVGPYAVIARSEARSGRAADWNCGAFFNIQ